jgi:hypothetical protein
MDELIKLVKSYLSQMDPMTVYSIIGAIVTMVLIITVIKYSRYRIWKELRSDIIASKYKGYSVADAAKKIPTDTSFRSILVKLSNDKDRFVSQTAHEALKRIENA